jgi:radical SAM superfamily enzyme YgiQ (UPF0313 family)
MRVGIIFAFMDYHRKGERHRGILQPQIGPLIAALLPPDVEVEVINETCEEPDWNRAYDLLFISCLHSDFDRARQLSHYWRRRGAKTVFGGTMASTYTRLCELFFDSIIIGDPEGAVPEVYKDFCKGEMKPIYISRSYDVEKVPVPRFDLLADKQMVPISLEITRGCPFACEFCALTAVGTRYHTRPPELVVRDIKAAQRMLRGLIPSYKLNKVVFNDNNIGGNFSYLKRLCEALTPLKLRWGSAITFNAVTNIDVVKMLSRAGCRFLFIGLESFNPEAIADMRKFQNSIEETKRVISQCRKHGIIIVSGLMLNPMIDDCDYMRSVPAHLEESGLRVPSFICFECPIPGTPHFHRVASEESQGFLPNALLRDFTGYTLVTRPRRATLEDFVDSYKRLVEVTYSDRARYRKLADGILEFFANGFPMSVLVELVSHLSSKWEHHPARTFVAGTDVAPPEASSVPLVDDDFDSEQQRREILEPWRVTDSRGCLLPQWAQSTKVYDPKGRISIGVQQLVMDYAAG